MATPPMRRAARRVRAPRAMDARATLTTLAAVAALVVPPRAAHTCTVALILGPTAPGDGRTFAPSNATLYIDARGFAEHAMEVTAISESGASSIGRVRALSPDLAQATLALQPDERSEVVVTVPDLGIVHRLSVRVGSRPDTDAPEQVGAPVLSVRDLPEDLCFPARRVVTAQVDEVRDDQGIAAYTLEVVTPTGTHVVGHRVWNDGASADRLPGVWIDASLPLGERGCYRVVAHDYSGNTTPGPMTCLAQPPVDDGGGVMPPPPLPDAASLDSGGLDAGAPDQGEPLPDAGLRADARGTAGTLETIDPECGCRTTRDAGTPGAMLLALLAWATLRTRSRPR